MLLLTGNLNFEVVTGWPEFRKGVLDMVRDISL